MTPQADPRYTDVADVDRVLAAVRERGAVALPDLIAVELCALGGAFQAVFDEPVWRAWLDLPDAYRQELAADAFRGLIARRLIDRPVSVPQLPGEPVARVAPPLSLIMTTRARPAFVLQCAAAGQQRGAPRMYGIADEDAGLRGLLVERASNERIGLGRPDRAVLSAEEDRARAGDLHQLYRYLLVDPSKAVSLLSSWLCAGPSRTLDVYRHQAGQELTRAELAVDPAPGGRFTVTGRFAAGDGAPVVGGAVDVAAEVRRIVVAECAP